MPSADDRGKPLTDDEAKAAWKKAQGLKGRPEDTSAQKQAAIVAVVLFVFAFSGMHFALGEPTDKSLVFGLIGAAVGTMRFVVRGMLRRR